MRTKFLFILASFLSLSIAISSCLDTDETTEYSTEATLYTFGLDSVNGRHYQFTIDQLQRIIYNRDSMPVQADTVLDRILIDSLTSSGWITSGAPNDTLMTTTDSVDLRAAINTDNGLKIKVHASDGMTSREYTLKINVHLQEPDSLVWNQEGTHPTGVIVGEQRSIIFNNELWIFMEGNLAHHTTAVSPTQNWTTSVLNGLPANIDIASITVLDETLYMTGADHQVYASTNGLDWNVVAALGNQVQAIVAPVGQKLSCIVEADGKRYFNTTDGSAWDETDVTKLAEVEEGFPVSHFYSAISTTSNGLDRTVIVGKTDAAQKSTTPWFSLDGKVWADLGTTDMACPYMENPSIICYDGIYYITGGDMSTIYASTTAIGWEATTELFMPHKSFKGHTSYSLCLAPTHHIWVVFGGNGQENEIWRGRVNKMGFIIR